jgi:PAT family beta-lactamase induction signal transducer AmpG
LDESSSAPARPVHPALFMVLYLPFGATAGFLATTLESYYSRAGVSTAIMGGVISLALAPHVFKVLWAPIVDTTLNTKAWYVMAVLAICAGVTGASFLPVRPDSLPTLTVLAVLASLAATFAGMACESLMAHATLPERRGAAGGWSQAGNVGGAGLGGAAGLALSDYFHSLPIAGALMAAIFIACVAALLLAPASTQHPRHDSYLQTLKVVVADCWSVCRARRGALALLLFVLPMGTGGAATIFASIAKDWNASPMMLAKTAGIAGLCTALAAVAAGQILDRVDRKAAYLAFGIFEGLIAAGMAISPREPIWFVLFASAYGASLGLVYAGFAAVTLESIGAGAAATKYNLFASVSNVPVAIMPAVDGWAVTHWSAGAMLWLELAIAAAAALIFLAIATATRMKLAPAPA